MASSQPVLFILTQPQEVAGEDVVCVLVGNKTDLLEQEVDQMEQEDGDQSMTVTITRFPHRVPASTAMQLAQV